MHVGRCATGLPDPGGGGEKTHQDVAQRRRQLERFPAGGLDVGGSRRNVEASLCPRCRQNAPLVYRGAAAYCTACGAPRLPLTGSALKLAGQPSKVGGTITRVLGWLILGGGLLIGLALVLILAALGAPLWAMAAFGGPVAAVGLLVGYLLLRGGKSLQQSGDDEELATKNQAIFALANTHRGTLRAWDVAQSLQITPQEADDLLTKLAKQDSERVSVDVDDEGNILYRFRGIGWAPSPVAPAMAPNAPTPLKGRVRVPSSAPGVGPYGARVSEQVRVDTRERPEVPPEAGRIPEGALIEEEEAEPARQRAR